MRSSRQGAIPSDLGWLVDELDALSERLRTLEAPSGESLGSTVAKLSALVANIQAQLDAWVAGRWDNVLPAPAGMIPKTAPRQWATTRAPRPRGDDPYSGAGIRRHGVCSPPPRG